MLSELRQCPLNLRIHLLRLRVDQACRDSGNQMLESGPAMQRKSSRSKPQPEMDKEPEQKQRGGI